MKRRHVFSCLTIAFALAPPAAFAQGNVSRQIRENEDRLNQIRNQRTQLESEMRRLRGRVHAITAEIENIEQRKDATSRMVNEIDRQLNSMNFQLDTITLDLVLAEDALVEKHAILEHRLSEIYRRGRLWAFQVLLAAESFGDLLSRYKYLYLVSRQDRALAADVEDLRNRIAESRNEMLTVRNALARRRQDRSSELDEFRRLETQRQRRLATARQNEQVTQEQLESVAATEQAIQTRIAALEETLRRAAASSNAAALPVTITAEDLGTLPWPVDGSVIHGFGLTRLPNNTEVRQNGIGIRTDVGTDVKAVAGGQVVLAEPYGTYGPSVWIRHGGGFITLYLFLERLAVQAGDMVQAGDVLGQSGGQLSEWGPHVEFQIREGGVARDPANWLRPRR